MNSDSYTDLVGISRYLPVAALTCAQTVTLTLWVSLGICL